MRFKALSKVYCIDETGHLCSHYHMSSDKPHYHMHVK